MFCHIYKLQIEKELDNFGQIKNQKLLKHLQNCPTCQSWLNSLTQIKQQLQAASPITTDSSTQKIQQAVNQIISDTTKKQTPPITHKPHSSIRIRYAVTAAAMITIAIALFTIYSPDSNQNNYNEKIKSVTQLSSMLQNQTSTLKTLPEKMIESEIQNTKNTIQQSINFIQNCLPKELIAANLRQNNTETQ